MLEPQADGGQLCPKVLESNRYTKDTNRQIVLLHPIRLLSTARARDGVPETAPRTKRSERCEFGEVQRLR